MKNIICILGVLIGILSSLRAQFLYDDHVSIFSDVKAHAIGDVVTVLVVENANASRESKVNSSGSSNLAANGSVTGTLTDYLPVFGLSNSLSSSHDGSEGTEQKDKLTGKISARIVEISATGMIKIRGERTVEVNGETNVMQIEGSVRPRDIATDNTIYSYKLADAKVIYRKSGIQNKLFKPGAFQRATNWLIGVGLVVVAITGVLIS
jgi:flagellar L-ring protein precursor FlgH